jgi:hypothetical protein
LTSATFCNFKEPETKLKSFFQSITRKTGRKTLFGLEKNPILEGEKPYLDRRKTLFGQEKNPILGKRRSLFFFIYKVLQRLVLSEVH